MPTIVQYRDGEAPVNGYPDQIVSPRQGSACCVAGMEMLGDVLVEGTTTFQYKRCRHCGFTVRVILASVMDPAMLASVRKAFSALSGGD